MILCARLSYIVPSLNNLIISLFMRNWLVYILCEANKEPLYTLGKNCMHRVGVNFLYVWSRAVSVLLSNLSI